MNKTPLYILACLPLMTAAQKNKKDDRLMLGRIESHIHALSHDSMQGRSMGSTGEKLAAKYISSVFESYSLKPVGDSGFYQNFSVSKGLSVDPGSFLSVNGKILVQNRDYVFMSYNPETRIKALPGIGMLETGMPWFINLDDTIIQQAANPHFDLYSELRAQANDAAGKGATALFVYTKTAVPQGLEFKKVENGAAKIPVVYLRPETVKTFMADEYASLDIDMRCKIIETFRTGMNVMGYLDRGSPNTIIIGAHFDHLGYGDAGSIPEPGTNLIHNGADDNASGVSGMLELANSLRNSSTKNNYLFIAFSGEEPGLLGSRYYASHPTLPLKDVRFMINLDMIGRLKPEAPGLTVGGFGTAPYWGEIYGRSGKKGIYNPGLQFRFDSSGTGPSDHTSFYQKNIPVLFYFTGLHQDYHKSTDDADKINYEGETNIVKHILNLVETADAEIDKIAFTATREQIVSTQASFKVTLGIMPDYSFNGEGVRVDGVSENRPAKTAGLQAGDVIIKLGTHEVKNIEHYMQALSHFNKGDKTTVEVRRGNEKLNREIVF